MYALAGYQPWLKIIFVEFCNIDPSRKVGKQRAYTEWSCACLEKCTRQLFICSYRNSQICIYCYLFESLFICRKWVFRSRALWAKLWHRIWQIYIPRGICFASGTGTGRTCGAASAKVSCWFLIVTASLVSFFLKFIWRENKNVLLL